MRIAVIDARGRLQKVFEGKDWTSAELAAEIVKGTNRDPELSQIHWVDVHGQ